MKKLALAYLSLISFSVLADINLEKLAGTYNSNCSQTQINGKQGSAIETYSFGDAGEYLFERKWYEKLNCSGVIFAIEEEPGTLKIGMENTNNGFNPIGTFEVEYTNEISIDLGLIWVSGDYNKIRVARGLSVGTQNPMLGLFEFIRK